MSSRAEMTRAIERDQWFCPECDGDAGLKQRLVHQVREAVIRQQRPIEFVCLYCWAIVEWLNDPPKGPLTRIQVGPSPGRRLDFSHPCLSLK